MKSNKRILGVIPARYASSRFPGKPLADMVGKSMIQRVWEQASKADRLTKVLVATDNHAIYEHVQSFGGVALMTADHHRTGTERCAEVASHPLYAQYDALINIQGDEPLIDPEQINLLASLFDLNDTLIATLVRKLQNPEDLFNANIVKVVINLHHLAMYFSRSPIPYYRNQPLHQLTHIWHHIGIYGYTIPTLRQLANLEPTPCESAEMLEQLRWLENGFQIRTAISTHESYSVDTPEDLDKVCAIIQNLTEYPKPNSIHLP